MKIFAITGNYAPPGADSPAEVDWYMVADSALLRSSKPVFLPDDLGEIEAIPSAAIRIDRLGKSIAPRFASRYFASVAPAVNFVSRTMLSDLSRAGRPLTRAVSFDSSLLLGDFVEIRDGRLPEISYLCGDSSYIWSPDCMSVGVCDLISALSRNNTLKNGDIVLVALPPSGFRPVPENRLTAAIEGNMLLNNKIK